MITVYLRIELVPTLSKTSNPDYYTYYRQATYEDGLATFNSENSHTI